MKIKASVYGRPIEVTPLIDVLSAAILGGLGSGVFANLTEARELMKDGLGEVRIGEPDPQWTERYDRLYRDVYSRLAMTLAPVHDALANFRQT